MRTHSKVAWTLKVAVFALVLVGLTACSNDPKDNFRASTQEIHETFLQGTVSGHMDGEAFTFGSPEARDSKIRTAGGQQSLILTVGVKSYIAVIIVGNYHGEDTYQDYMSLSPFLAYSSPKEKFKTLEKTITVTQDSEDKLAGNFAFKVASVTNEKITVEGNFDFNKIIIDNNDDVSLLIELKGNPELMRSLGDRRADKDFVLKAIQQNSLAFLYSDDQLKTDKLFILRALKDQPTKVPALLMHADKELMRDKGFALKMLAVNQHAIHFLDSELKKDKEIINTSEK